VKARKTDKTVADMGVLKDIRGLLSASRESPAKEPSAKPAPDLDAEKAAIEEKLKQSQSAAKDMQAAISRLEAEKKGLEARVAALQSAVNSLPPPPSVTPRSAEALPAGTDRLARDVPCFRSRSKTWPDASHGSTKRQAISAPAVTSGA
jgi:hypothetical protein